MITHLQSESIHLSRTVVCVSPLVSVEWSTNTKSEGFSSASYIILGLIGVKLNQALNRLSFKKETEAERLVVLTMSEQVYEPLL